MRWGSWVRGGERGWEVGCTCISMSHLTVLQCISSGSVREQVLLDYAIHTSADSTVLQCHHSMCVMYTHMYSVHTVYSLHLQYMLTYGANQQYTTLATVYTSIAVH